MFKVICIHGSDFVLVTGSPAVPEDALIEGATYTVVEIEEYTNNERYLYLKEKLPNTGYNSKRFIPLSNIDELELTNHKKEVVNF